MLNPYDVMAGNKSGAGVVVRKKSGGMHGWWKGFDSKFMKPIFGGADPNLRRRRDTNSMDLDHLRGGADVNIGSTGDFELHAEAAGGKLGQTSTTDDEENVSLVSSDGQDVYNPPSKNQSEEIANAEHPGDIF